MGHSIEDGGDPARPFKVAAYYDANVFADITRSFAWSRATGCFDRGTWIWGKERNERFEMAGLFSSDSL